MIISWNTKKVQGGFEAIVHTFEYENQEKSVTIRRVKCRTRAIATNHAKKLVRYFKAMQRKHGDQAVLAA